MGYALTKTYRYLTREEGSFGVMTVTVLALASLVMLVCLISYPK